MHFDYAQYKQKGFAPILVLVGIMVILAAVAGAYYFGKLPIKPASTQFQIFTSSTPSAVVKEASNLKTYTNTDFAFEIKYSPFSIPGEEENGMATIIYFKNNIGHQVEPNLTPITILVNRNNLKTVIGDIKKGATSEAVIENLKASEEKPVYVSGIEGIHLRYEYNPPDKSWDTGLRAIDNVIVSHNNLVYIFTPLEDLSGFEKFLSTFRFLSKDEILKAIKPADAQTPTTKNCVGVSTEAVVLINLNKNGSSPKCLKVSTNQKLQVANLTAELIKVTLGQEEMQIPAYQMATIYRPFRSYLAPGVHFLKTSLYNKNSSEIWLQ